MANLYGIANGTPNAVTQAAVSGGGNTTCPAGSETTIFSIPAFAMSPGYFYPVIFVQMWIGYGATVPTTLQVAAKIGAGSDFDTLPINTGVVTASTNVFYCYVLVGPESQTVYVPPGVTINVTLAPTIQAVTLIGGGSRTMLWLSRGQDT